MVSFDVKDLFTSIPPNETITICFGLLFDDVSSVHILTRKLFSGMLELWVFSSFFIFDKNYYKQNEGLSMGLSLSPTLANIFLCFDETVGLRNCPPQLPTGILQKVRG